MQNINNTLYIPLYAKAYVSRKQLFLSDKTAEAIWAEAAFPLGRKSRSAWLAYFLGIRAAVFDAWVTEQLRDTTDTVVLHIGCGLDSRIHRVGAVSTLWVDVDFPEVIDERRRYFTESDMYRMIAGDVRQDAWLSSLPKARRAVVVMEGVSMYLTPDELRGIFAALHERFETINLLTDNYSALGAKLSKYKNPINEVGMTTVYGTDDPTAAECGKLRFKAAHDITPAHYIQALRGGERWIFKMLYAGCIAKKMYRLWEYRKE